MTDEEKGPVDEKEPIGRLSGKTTSHTVKMLISDESISRNDYFVIHNKQGTENEHPYFILNSIEMWTDTKGFKAKLQVLGDRPKRPFEMGAPVYLAEEEHIMKVLGIDNPPELSVALGKLMGYDFDVNLMVKNFGRIFITGKSGSGKSYTMGVLIEEFLDKGIPVVIIDRHGEYGSLKVASEEYKEETYVEGEELSEFCPWCGVAISKTSTICDQCGKELPIDEKEAKKAKTPGESKYVDSIIEFSDLKTNKGGDIDIDYLFSLEATDLVAPNLCSIINLRGMDLEVQEMVAGKVLQKLYQASTRRAIPPFYLFLDEAHLFAGKKQTDTCDTVKLFSQEGRKFGANIVISTQRPQLLDTTIRAQAGTWIVHQLSDVRDIGITISSAEDLSKENKEDIAGLAKGQGIICGEAVKNIPLFVQVRRRITKHGGVGFNPLDFISEKRAEEQKKRKERLLGQKSEEELEASKTVFQEMKKPKTVNDYLDEIAQLELEKKELKKEIEKWKGLYEQAKGGKIEPSEELETERTEEKEPRDTNQEIINLQKELKLWKEKYETLKSMKDAGKPNVKTDDGEIVKKLKSEAGKLKAEAQEWKEKYQNAIQLAEKSINELKKYQN